MRRLWERYFPERLRIADPRLRILAWASFLALICGAIEFGEPLEDMLKGGRDIVRAQRASGNIIVVGVDDRTTNELKSLNFSRKYHAQAIDKLFALGARRVFFDFIFSGRTTPAEDALFARTLARYRGRIFIGSINIPNPQTGKMAEILPRPEFQSAATTLTALGQSTPFSISAEFPYRDKLRGRYIPSISSRLAEKNVNSDEFYRPDWSISATSIPTISFIDLINNENFQTGVAGKDVIVGPSAMVFNDIHYIISQGFIPGVYFHVIGAETLKRGIPRNYGWIPAFIAALLLAACNLFARSRRASRMTLVFAIGCLGGMPLYLDSNLITVDIVPGAMLFMITAYRGMTLRRVVTSGHTNLVSGLPNLAALRHLNTRRDATLIALKLRNLAEIASSFDQVVERLVIDELKRRIEIGGAKIEVFHGEDTLLWFSPLPMGPDLASHLEGLNGVFNSAMPINGRNIDLSLAFGVDGDRERSMTSRIGSAMLCAEEAARGNDIWKFYDPQRRHEAAWQLSLLSRLDQAIDNGEIWVAYQPKLHIHSDTLTGAEALVRWEHPERGLISPEDFILVAEKHNRIERLTSFVLDQAIEAAAQLNARGIDFSIAVNLSAQLLQIPTLLEMVDGILRRYNLPPEKLILEITETGQLDRNGSSIAMMERLATHGIHVSIDDYGTGNATLDYLKILPSDEVKIDRQFIATIDTNLQDRILVASTIEMVHSLGRKVVAEGVETLPVLRELKLLGCDTAQGYLIGRPVRFATLARQLTAKIDRAAA